MADRPAEALWSAIRADPASDEARLVYADWVSDRGETDRASLIRTQVRRAQLPLHHPDQVTLKLREWSLRTEVFLIWAELMDVADVGWGEPRRGFVDRMSLEDPVLWDALGPHCLDRTLVDGVQLPWSRLGNGRWLRAHERLRELTVRGTVVDLEDVTWLANSPILSTVKRLSLFRSDLDGSQLRALLASPHLGELEALRLPYNHLGDDAIGALVERNFEGLAELDLSTYTFDDFQSQGRDVPTMGPRGAERLAEWPGLASVRRLRLDGQQLQREGLAVLLASPHLRGLRHLSVRGISDWDVDRGRPDALVAFRTAHPELRLASLSFGDCELSVQGAEALASSPAVSELHTLWMGQIREPQPPRVDILAEAGFISGLAVLHVDQIWAAHQFWRRVIDRAPPRLHTISTDAYFPWARHRDFLRCLATGPTQPSLRSLEVVEGDVGADALGALGNTSSLPALQRLAISSMGHHSRHRTSGLPEELARALHSSPLAEQLTSLEMGQPDLDRLPQPGR
ncbi:MAG: TIGR02996 domain-containing protein [Myxococcales bacterium]|nr:TIGR02996 domain-containing protein [Myxococcales bacterium]